MHVCVQVHDLLGIPNVYDCTTSVLQLLVDSTCDLSMHLCVRACVRECVHARMLAVFADECARRLVVQQEQHGPSTRDQLPDKSV